MFSELLGMHQVACYSVAVSCKASVGVGFARGEQCVTVSESEWESLDRKDPCWCQQQCIKGTSSSASKVGCIAATH